MIGENFPRTLEAARTGAEWAWTGIYRDLAPAVLGYLRARRAHEPEDLTGEVFLQVVRDLPRFHGGESEFRAWVFVIAHHRLQDHRRQRARRPEPGEFVDVGAMTGGDAEDDALRSIATGRVYELCARLAPDQRDVLLLRIVGDLTVDDVAAALGKTSGAVKALQRRGFEALRKIFEQEGVPL